MRRPYKQFFESENVMFDTAEDVRNYILKKSKEYGSRNEYLSSKEYHNLYPQIKYLFDIEKDLRKKKTAVAAAEAMKSVNANFGDTVYYDVVSPFGHVQSYEGIIVNRNGVPYVKYLHGLKNMKGGNSSLWHKGWRKK